MTCRIRLPLLLAAAVLVPASASEACWCSSAYTRSYLSPCATCPTVNRSCYIPVAACPTTSCSTTTVARCYYEPQVVYQTRTVLRPQIGLVRRSYYDPLTCCYRSYWLPAPQYVERSYLVPVTTWTKSCTTEPETACATTYTHSATYWSPNGVHYYSWPPSHAGCPVPDSNGSINRDSSYGTPPDATKRKNYGGDVPQAPEPKPMPSKPTKEGARFQTPQPSATLTARSASPVVLTRPRPGFVYPASERTARTGR